MNTRPRSTWTIKALITFILVTWLLAAFAGITQAMPIGPDTDPRSSDRTAATITVQSAADDGTAVPANCPGAGCRLRDALANATAGDTITFDGDYTITLASELTIDKDVTIDGAGHNVTISGNDAVRVFNVAAGHVTFAYLTIADGTAPITAVGCGGSRCGGGILLQNSGVMVTVAHSTLSGNVAAYDGDNGGGIYNNGGTLMVQNSTLSSNHSGYYGGGIYNNGGTLTIQDSTLAGNHADAGAGVSNAGTLTVLNSTLANNISDDWVGTGDGGGLRNLTGNATLTNVTFSGNQAVNAAGGGVRVDGGDVILTNVTFSGNSAATGSGISRSSGNVTINNSLIANSPAGDNCSGSLSGSYNLADDATCGAGFTNSSSIQLGTLGDYGGSTFTIPLLPGSAAIDATSTNCPAADQRGVVRPQGAACDIGAFESRGFALTKTGGDNQSATIHATFPIPLALSVTSAYTEPVDGGAVTFAGPLADAGTDPITTTATITGGAASRTVMANYFVGTYSVTASTAGAANVAFALTNCPMHTVTNDADSGPGSLRQAIADSCAGDTITFSGDYTVTLASELIIDKNLTITGVGHNVTINGNDAVRVFYVNAGVTFNLQNLTVANGAAPTGGSTCPTYCGGGLLNLGTAVVSNSTFDGNNASALGGGIWTAGTLTVTASTFTNNRSSAFDGGGISSDSSANLSVSDSAFTSNVGATGGGALYLNGPISLITNNIFTSNHADVGGAIHSNSAVVTITNNTFISNTAIDRGAVDIRIGSGRVLFNTFYNNSASEVSDSIGVQTAQGGSLTVSNNIFFAPTTNNCDGTIVDGGGNLQYPIGSNCPALTANPLLGPLANYGGHTQSMVLLPGSPAIDAGDDGSCPPTDQRGVSRPQGAHCDVGAFEARGFTLIKSGGDSQSTAIDTAFTDPLSVILSETGGSGLPGAVITFTAPASGASIAPTTTIGTPTNASGLAAVSVTANSTAGSYAVVASASGAMPSVTFNLTNSLANTFTITPTAGANGTITPGTPQSVNYGEAITFTITPDSGYSIADVGVDGVSQGPFGLYTFTNVTASHTISAAFTSTGSQTRTIGVINVMADTFAELGNGQTLATGNIRLGQYLYLTDPADSVLYDTTTLTATGKVTIIADGSTLNVVTGTFAAPISTGVALPIGTPDDLITSAAGFVLTDVVVSDINLPIDQFSVSANLNVQAKDITITTGVDLRVTGAGSGIIYSGTLGAFDFVVGGVTVTVAPSMTLSNAGIAIPAATITLPESLGGASAAVNNLTITSEGLTLEDGTITLPDIKWGDGSKIQLLQPIAHLSILTETYQFSAISTLSLTLPSNNLTTTLGFTLTQDGQMTGTLSNLNLTVAGSMLTMTNLAVSNAGFAVTTATLQLPASLGSGTANLSNVGVYSNGLNLGSGTFALPVINIGDGSRISMTNSTAQLAIADNEYDLAVTSTLNLNLPSNAFTTTLGFALHAGQMTGTLDSLNLSVAGATLGMTNALISNAGFAVATATLQLPSSLGSGTANLSNVGVYSNGLNLGSGTFALPVIKIGDGSRISMTNSLAQLSISNNQYNFAVTSTLNLNLPSNALTTTLSFAMQNGQMTGTLSSLHLTMAGSTLIMTDVVVSNAGLSVDSAVLQLPASLGSTAASIGGLTIDQSGLTLEQGTLALPDIKWGDGSKVKIAHPVAQLTVLNNQYQFSASGTLSLTLPNNNINSTLGFTVTNGGQLTGTVNVLNLTLAGGTLTMTNIAVTNSGLSVAAAQLKLPSSLGGGLATVNDVTIDANGLSVSAGTFTVADINIGDGSKVKIANPTATLSNTVEGYTFGISGTLQLRLPDNSQNIVISGTVNTSGQFYATISSISLTLAKATLQLNQISMDNTGLSVVSGTLQLPAKLGGVSGQVADVRIDANGLSIGSGSANFPIPDFKIGGTAGFGVSGALATLNLVNTSGSMSYQMALSGTIAITLPGTSATAHGLVQMDNAGNISGRVDAFTLAVAGLSLSVNNISINSDGSFAIASATLALPGGFGGGSASVGNVVVYPGQPGSLSLGSAGISLPDIKWGDGSKVKIINANAQLTQVNNKYSFAFGGKLSLNLPANVVTSTLAFSIRDDGQISGTVDLIKLTVAGGTLTMTNVGVTNSGLTVGAASLKMPASLGSAIVTINGVSINETGLHLGGGQLTLADINVGDGSKVKIAAPTATLGSLPSGYTFGISGTLQLRLPSNSQNISIGGTINTSGQFTATVSAMSLTFGGATLNLSDVTMNNSGLSVVSGTLQLPAKLGGASGGVNNVVINANGLSIGGGSLTFPIPDFKIGGASGFSVSNAQAGLQLTNGGLSYRLNLSGTVAIKIPGSNAIASGRVSMDDAGNMSGQVDAFTLTIAGMGLNVSNISINPDGSFTAGAAGFTTPSGFGGASASVYNVVIRPGNPGSVSIGGGAFTLPPIKAGGFGLALSGALKPITSGYEISATGFATFPGVGGAAGCEGVGVGATIWTDAQGQTQLALRPDETNGLALKNASFNLQCQIAIGTTGFFITGIQGAVTLGPTSTEVNVGIQIAAGKKIAGFTVLSADATATIKTNPFDLLINGAVRVFVFQVGGATAHMTDHSFSATLWVNMIVAKGDIAFNAWSDYRGFHMNGSGSMQVGLAKGSIFNGTSLPYPCCECGWQSGWLGVPYWWCGNCQICWTESLTIPSSDYLFNTNTAFGEFEGDRWGVKGTVSLLGYNAGFFVDSQGNLTVGTVDNYNLIEPEQVNAAIEKWQAARRNGLAPEAAFEIDGIRFVGDNILVPQPITTTTDVIFALQRSQSVPTLTLMTPTGVEITPQNLPANVQFIEVLTYTRSVSTTTSSAPLCAASETVQKAEQTALVRFTHARSDLGAIDVLIDGVKVFDNLDFGAESIAQVMEAGAHTLDLVPANQPGPIVHSTPITLTGNVVHRLIAAGDVTQTVTLDVAQGVAPAAGQATIRFAHALADAAHVDVVLANDGRMLFGDVAPQSVTDGINLDASQTYTFEVYAAGTPQLLAQLPNVTLTGRGTYSLIALGRTSGVPSAQLLLKADTLPLSHLRFVNAIAADQPIDLWTQGIMLFANLPYSATSAYNGFAGDSINFQLTPAGISTTVLYNGSISLQGEADHTLVALDYVTQTQTLLLVDDNRLPAWGKARVRFVNAAPNAGTVDVSVQGASQFNNIAFKNASDYVELNGGTVTIEVRDHATQNVLLSVPNVNVIDGYVYTWFLMGISGGTPALQLVPIVDLATRPDVQTQYVVDQAQAGTWELKLNGNFTATDRYLLTALGSNPAPALSDLSATISGTTSLALSWRLSSDELGTPIGIYADPGTDLSYAGRALVANLTSPDPNWINGTLQTYSVNLNQLSSGTYRIWFEANDGRNTPVRQYAPQTIVVNHVATWPLTWTTVMTVTPGFRELNVQWQPHANPDTDVYVLKVSELTTTQVISVGNLTSALVTALEPDKPYSLTVQAIDNDTGHVSTAQTVVGVPANAAINLSGPAGPINVIAGQSQNTALLITTSDEPYPGVVSFQTGCVRLNGATCTSSVNGLNALFADEHVTPTLAGVSESIVISATELVPAGNYVVPIIAMGSGVSRTFEIAVQVNVPAFTLDVDSHAVLLGIAEAREVTVSSAGLNGATRPIGLSVKNAPVGLLWTLSNDVIDPGESATLTITDTDLLASGLYPIEIRGDDGLITATTTITLTVSKPRFTLTATPSNVTVGAGQPLTTVFKLDVLALDGWTTPITLTVGPSAMPAPGALGLRPYASTGALSNTLLVAPGGSAYLVAVTAADTPHGLYTFSIDAQGGGRQQTLEVMLAVTAVNDAPIAVNDLYTTTQDTVLTIVAPGVLGNDTDADGPAALTAIKVTDPAHGIVTLSANGSFIYTPTVSYSGGDSFTYKANDSALDSNVATVNLTVNTVNHAPVAVSNSYTATMNTALTVTAPGVLGNDSDADGNALTAIKVTNPAHGTLTLNADGSFVYTATVGYTGSDTFTYKANDGAADSNIVAVTLTVKAVVYLPLVVR